MPNQKSKRVPFILSETSLSGCVTKVYTRAKGAANSCERLLVIRKTETVKSVEIKYALSNPTDGLYATTELILMQSQRYFIERAFQVAKQEMGRSQYQLSGWLAWHHHIALVMMSVQFVLTEKMLFKIEYHLLNSYNIREVFNRMYATKRINF